MTVKTKAKNIVVAKEKKNPGHLIISDKKKISYDSIQKIDKTKFKSKGYFVVTYKNDDGGEVAQKISDKTYDNLEPILELLVAKIT